MKMRFLTTLVLILSVLAVPAVAVEPDEMLKDPKLEARARALSQNLRCLVCQNQNIDDSNAGLAKDLRIKLRERLLAGDTDEQAVSYLVDRFGEFVLLKPRFAAHTLVLWLGPFVLLAIGIFSLWRMQSNRKSVSVAEKELSPEERNRLKELLDDQQS